MSASPDRSLAVCFVCLGNICRSPTAEGVMKRLVREAGLAARIHVESAGSGAWHLDEPADPRARAAAQARGVSLDGRAQQFTADDFARFDYVLSMDKRVRAALDALARTPDQRRRVHNFRDFDAGSPTSAEVPDPYYGGADGFERVFDICDAACRGLLAHMRQELGASDGSGAR
jgi:protein-tyrosine phosphatase